MTRKFAAVAAMAMIVGIGTASAATYSGAHPGSMNQIHKFSGNTYSGGSDLSISGGSDLPTGGQGMGLGNTWDQFECVKATNQGNASNVKAFCPPNRWLPDQ